MKRVPDPSSAVCESVGHDWQTTADHCGVRCRRCGAVEVFTMTYDTPVRTCHLGWLLALGVVLGLYWGYAFLSAP